MMNTDWTCDCVAMVTPLYILLMLTLDACRPSHLQAQEPQHAIKEHCS
jgi:hypothetical protein